MAEWEDPDDRWLDRLRTGDASVPRQRSSNPRDWLDIPWTDEGRAALDRGGDRHDDAGATP